MLRKPSSIKRNHQHENKISNLSYYYIDRITFSKYKDVIFKKFMQANMEMEQ